MSAFNPGNGGDLTATNIPAAFLEFAILLLNSQRQANAHNLGWELIKISFDLTAWKVVISANIPGVIPVILGNSILYQSLVPAGLPFNNFNAGGGQLTAQSKTEGFLQVAELLSNAEKAQSAFRYLSLQASENFLVSIEARLPIQLIRSSSGETMVIAVDYLFNE